MDLVATLQRLVAIDSTSTRSNVPVVDLVEELVRPLGFATRRLDWTDPQGVPKTNLLCRRGPERPGGLALVGHTDCVPFDPAWAGALAGEVRDGKLYGRGACDTKGFVAAALVAASCTAARELPAAPPLHQRRGDRLHRRQVGAGGRARRPSTPSWASPPRSCRCGRTRGTAPWT